MIDKQIDSCCKTLCSRRQSYVNIYNNLKKITISQISPILVIVKV